MNEKIGQTEPPADIRAAAQVMWQMFAALKQQGFTEAQALAMLGNMMAAIVAEGMKGSS